jgi:electron transport complex protein RnfC
VVCPSHLPLVESFLFSQEQQAKAQAERERADHARQRYEARISRLQRQEIERERVRFERKTALEQNSSPRIHEAIERARQKQQAMSTAILKESIDDDRH